MYDVHLNFLRDTAEIKIYYDEPQESNSAFAWLDAELSQVLESSRFSNDTTGGSEL